MPSQHNAASLPDNIWSGLLDGLADNQAVGRLRCASLMSQDLLGTATLSCCGASLLVVVLCAVQSHLPGMAAGF
jgi:hypothetical protein